MGAILTQPAQAAGNVLGTGASTDHALPRWHGVDGRHLQNSGVILDDSDNMTGLGSLSLDGIVNQSVVRTDTSGIVAPSLCQAEFTGSLDNNLNNLGLRSYQVWNGTPNGFSVVQAGVYAESIASANANTLYGGMFAASLTAGTTTVAYGLYASVSQGAGVITTGYGLYISLVGAATGWAVYNASGKNWSLGTAAEVIQMRDAAITLGSLNDGHLDFTADISVDVNAPTLNARAVTLTASITLPADGTAWIGTGAAGVRLIPELAVTQWTLAGGDLMLGGAKRVYFEAVGTTKGTESIYSANDGYMDYAAATQHRFNTGDVMFSPAAALKTYWRDSAIYIASLNDGYLDIVADTSIRLGCNLDVGSTRRVNFFDSAVYIHSYGDGRMDIVSDGYVFITAPSGLYASSFYMSRTGDATGPGAQKDSGSLLMQVSTWYGGAAASRYARMYGEASSNPDGYLSLQFTIQKPDATTLYPCYLYSDGDWYFQEAYKTHWRDSAIYIWSAADGTLDHVCDGAMTFTASGAQRLYLSTTSLLSCSTFAQYGYDFGVYAIGASSGPAGMLGYNGDLLLHGATGRQKVVLTTGANYGKDHDHAAQTNPTLYGHDARDPDVSNNAWWSITHDATGMLVSTGANIGTGTVPATIDNYIRFSPRGTLALELTGAGSVVCGAQAALATNATDGFLYVPTCAGAPTGVPTAYTGKVAVVFDTTNHDLYVYDTAWIKVEPA